MKYKDEELIEWIKSFPTIKDMRQDNYARYQMCLKRGLGDYFPTIHASQLYTDEELIEWIKSFDTIKVMREDSFSKYQMCIRRGLKVHFPPKRTKSGNLVDPLRKQRIEDERRQKREEKQKLKEEKERQKQEKNANRREVANNRQDITRNNPQTLYPSFYIGEVKTCVRCKNTPASKTISMCNPCNNEVLRLIRSNEYTTLGNIRDEFCRTRITFENGDRMEFEYDATYEQIQRLFREGYGFILKPRKYE
jgi:hypothetical protein